MYEFIGLLRTKRKIESLAFFKHPTGLERSDLKVAQASKFLLDLPLFIVGKVRSIP
jgi:hypothetical protein